MNTRQFLENHGHDGRDDDTFTTSDDEPTESDMEFLNDRPDDELEVELPR